MRDPFREYPDGGVDGERTPSPVTARPGASQASRLIALAASVELFRTPEGEPFATFPVGEHRETAPVKSKAFRRYLVRLYYGDAQATPNAQAVQDALGVLEGRAVYEGETLPVYVRVAESDGAIYLDLCDGRWQVVEITRTGWAITSNSPVKFRRARGMLPLPTPLPGGSVAALDQYVNVGSDADRRLVVAWLLAALRPRGPYPVLVLHGEQGSAKSTTARVLRALVDPNTAALRAEPRDEHDLVIAATNGWTIALDNVSHLPPRLSDALCRLATGGGFATRELYSDADEVLFDAMRPIILNGIEEIATRGDLLDRSLLVDLPAIPEEERRAEAEFWQTFEAARPAILGALLDGVVTALRQLPGVRLPRLPRMADFAMWTTAAAPALGWGEEAFLDAYMTNREAANDLTLDASPVAAPVRALASEGDFEGTATALLNALQKLVGDSITRQRGWPKGARGLSGILRRLAPNLRAVGVRVEFPAGHHPRTIRVTTVPTVPTVPRRAQGEQGRDADGHGRDADGDANGGGRDGESPYSTGRRTQGDGRDANSPGDSERLLGLDGVLDIFTADGERPTVVPLPERRR